MGIPSRLPKLLYTCIKSYIQGTNTKSLSVVVMAEQCREVCDLNLRSPQVSVFQRDLCAPLVFRGQMCSRHLLDFSILKAVDQEEVVSGIGPHRRRAMASRPVLSCVLMDRCVGERTGEWELDGTLSFCQPTVNSVSQMQPGPVLFVFWSSPLLEHTLAPNVGPVSHPNVV